MLRFSKSLAFWKPGMPKGASRKRSLRSLCCGGAIFLWLFSGVVIAQTNTGKRQTDKSSDTKTSRISIASNSGPPGSVVVLPIYFTPAPGERIGRLKLELSFVSPSLKFEKIETAAAGKAGNVEVTSDVGTAKNAKGTESTTVTVLANLPSREGPTKGMPAGMLAALNFRINQKARPAKIILHAKAEGERLESNTPVDLSVSDAHIEVAWVDAPPSVSCFFFSH